MEETGYFFNKKYDVGFFRYSPDINQLTSIKDLAVRLRRCKRRVCRKC